LRAGRIDADQAQRLLDALADGEDG
jgi:hypothetical protein